VLNGGRGGKPKVGQGIVQRSIQVQILKSHSCKSTVNYWGGFDGVERCMYFYIC
jgi:hypothetical protein